MTDNSISPSCAEETIVIGYVSCSDLEWAGDCTLRRTAMQDYKTPVMLVAQHEEEVAKLKAEIEILQKARGA